MTGSECVSLLGVITGLSHKGCREDGPSFTCLAKAELAWILDPKPLPFVGNLGLKEFEER